MPTADSTNSFVTKSEADTYFDTMYNRYAVWNAIVDTPEASDDKSRLLIEASRILIYQLDWAITIDEDAPGDTDPDYLPIIQIACCELVWALFLKDRQLEPDSKGVLRMKLDVLEIENDKTDRGGVIPSNVLDYLRDLITGYSGGVNIPLELE